MRGIGEVGKECKGKVDVHHPIGCEWRGMGQKASDFETIPLCHEGHHQFGRNAIHQMGKRPWEAKYGSQRELLEQTLEKLSSTALLEV